MRPSIDIALRTGSTRLQLPPPSECTISQGEHGLEAVQIQYDLSRYRAFELLNQLSAGLSVQVGAGGAVIADARVEDISIDDQGVTVQALGRWRALRDVPYTALWSDTTHTRWRPTAHGEVVNRTPDRYGFDTGENLFITLKKGASYANNSGVGSLVYLPPDRTSRQINGLQIGYRILLPANWTFRIVAYGGSPGAFTVGPVIVGPITATGSLQTIGTFTTFTATTYLAIEIFNSTGALYTNVQEDGDFYVVVDYIRLVTVNSNTINTTLGTAVAAPGTQAVTPGSMAGIYVGQTLNIGGANPEAVTVASITATTFTATFARTHLAADSLRAFLLYASDIAPALVAEVNTANAGALSTSNALIQLSGLDLLDQVYEDADMGEILTTLASLGDSSGQRYEVGVDGSTLYFRPVGDAAQAWYVDASELQVQQTLDQLYNSVYATYQDANGRTLRTASQSDTASITRYGLTRRRAIPANTSNATLAVRVAQTARDDTKNPIPRASLRFPRVYTATGAQAPLWQVRNGDTITIRNLPPVAGAAVDLIRTFRVFDCEYDAAGDALSVTPETPLPLLEYLLARQAAFGDVAAGRLAR